MTPSIRHRLTKTDNIKPLLKRKNKKANANQNDFEPKRSEYVKIILLLSFPYQMPNDIIYAYVWYICSFSDKAILISPKKLSPDPGIVLKAFLSARLCAAIWSHITDCDETYNFWEPLHYLVYGNGMQTWEYSPKYALRSYTYILFHAVPATFYRLTFQPSPVLIFYFVRCILGLICAAMETYFYKLGNISVVQNLCLS